jgi:FtsH-binding integral membrane protein
MYEVATVVLREASRDRNAFPLVYEENCNYGFRRNLWGLKPVGLSLTLVACLLLGAVLVKELLSTATASPVLGLAVAAAMVLLMLWIGVVRPTWVRSTAFAYAERLLAAALTLGEPNKEE